MRMVPSVFPGGGHHRKEDGGSVRALAGVLQAGPGAFSWEELGFSTGKWPHPGGALPEARAMRPPPTGPAEAGGGTSCWPALEDCGVENRAKGRLGDHNFPKKNNSRKEKSMKPY